MDRNSSTFDILPRLIEPRLQTSESSSLVTSVPFVLASYSYEDQTISPPITGVNRSSLYEKLGSV